LSLSPIKFVDSGLLIISRFPLEKVGEVTYTTLMDEDKLATKGALFVLVDVPSTKGTEKVAVCTTHLQAGYGKGKRMDIRNQEVATIAQCFNHLVCKSGMQLSSYPSIVTGDFNTCCFKEEQDYMSMLAKLNTNFQARELKDIVSIFQPQSNTEGDRRVDYIFSNLWCESCQVVDFKLSDHKAVEAVLCVS